MKIKTSFFNFIFWYILKILTCCGKFACSKSRVFARSGLKILPDFRMIRFYAQRLWHDAVQASRTYDNKISVRVIYNKIFCSLFLKWSSLFKNNKDLPNIVFPEWEFFWENLDRLWATLNSYLSDLKLRPKPLQ